MIIGGWGLKDDARARVLFREALQIITGSWLAVGWQFTSRNSSEIRHCQSADKVCYSKMLNLLPVR